MKYEFRQPVGADVFEQIFRLNHRVFVEELGQYPPSPDGRLIDKFHDRNTYFAAFHGAALAGMIALHDRPPFSIEQRLRGADALAGLARPLLEARLLAVDAEHRHSMIVGGLFAAVYLWARDRGYGTLLMSGLSERLALYRKLGFRELGPAVAYGAASFAPMALEILEVPERLARHAGILGARRQ